MVFANFNLEKFPEVLVKFTEYVKDDTEFNKYLSDWMELYKRNCNFYYIFDTTTTGLINIKYCFKMSKFINKLKKEKLTSLKCSVIILKSPSVIFLVKQLFKLTSPVADIYLVNDINDVNIIKYYIRENINSEKIDFELLNHLLKKNNIKYEHIKP